LEDLESLLALHAELADSPATTTPVGDPAARAVLRTMLDDPARHLAVASVDDDVVGTADMLIAQNLTHLARPWGIIENVVVSTGHRRNGVGEALMGYLIGIARAAGCYKVQLLSAEHRGEAHSFYRALGFRSVAAGFKLYLDDSGG
jgi:ribosomal protein S18 acetylase RimI-like enzyme